MKLKDFLKGSMKGTLMRVDYTYIASNVSSYTLYSKYLYENFDITFSKLADIKHGAHVLICDMPVDNWLKIIYRGSLGYVSAGLIHHLVRV